MKITPEQQQKIITILITSVITAALSIAGILGYAVPALTTACQ